MKSHRLRGKSEAYRGYLRDKVASPVQYDEVYYQVLIRNIETNVDPIILSDTCPSYKHVFAKFVQPG